MTSGEDTLVEEGPIVKRVFTWDDVKVEKNIVTFENDIVTV